MHKKKARARPCGSKFMRRRACRSNPCVKPSRLGSDTILLSPMRRERSSSKQNAEVPAGGCSCALRVGHGRSASGSSKRHRARASPFSWMSHLQPALRSKPTCATSSLTKLPHRLRQASRILPSRRNRRRPCPRRRLHLPCAWFSAVVCSGRGGRLRISPGLLLWGHARWTHVSLGLEARVDLPRSLPAGTGAIEAFVAFSTAAGCVHLAPAAACALAGGGVLRAEGLDLMDAARITAPYAVAGGSIQVRIELVPSLALLVRFDVLATLTRVVLRVDGAPAWSTEPLSLSLAVGIEWAA